MERPESIVFMIGSNGTASRTIEVVNYILGNMQKPDWQLSKRWPTSINELKRFSGTICDFPVSIFFTDKPEALVLSESISPRKTVLVLPEVGSLEETEKFDFLCTIVNEKKNDGSKKEEGELIWLKLADLFKSWEALGSCPAWRRD